MMPYRPRNRPWNVWRLDVPDVLVLADDQYKWFWWIAPILVLSVLVIIGMLCGGYIRKVLIPRVKGRRVE
jgi:hypothetical protein